MSDSDSAEWETVGFVGSSKYREAVLLTLDADGAATPSQLRDETGHSIASISNALKRLREENLVQLLVDEDRQKGRYYGTLPLGELVADKLRSETA